MRLAAVALALAACGPELNPPRAPDGLADGGVYVAYNLGCERGCDRLRRGDRIVAVDGLAVASGAEFDMLAMTGIPRTLKVARYGTTDIRDIRFIADMDDGLPALITVGAHALDRAPAWARGKLFGHTIPEIDLSGYGSSRSVTGRDLYGRNSLIFVWRDDPLRRDYERAPDIYAELQRHADALRLAGVDIYFTLDGYIRVNDEKPEEHLRSRATPGETGFIPISALGSAGSTHVLWGIDGTTELRDYFGDDETPVLLVIDRRGVVRFHADASHAPDDRLAAAVEFARTSLRELPAATR
jgi:hypothetical protein